MVAKKPLPVEIKTDLTAYVNCVAGALLVEEYEILLRNAGFVGKPPHLTTFSWSEDIHSRYSTRRYQKWLERVLRKERLLRSPVFQHGSTAETNIWNQRMGWWDWHSINGRFCFSLILSFSASYQIYAVKNGTRSENQLSVLRQWWDAYPAAKSSPPSITGEELAALIRNPSVTREFAVIDVRRDDYAVSIDIFCFGFI